MHALFSVYALGVIHCTSLSLLCTAPVVYSWALWVALHSGRRPLKITTSRTTLSRHYLKVGVYLYSQCKAKAAYISLGVSHLYSQCKAKAAYISLGVSHLYSQCKAKAAYISLGVSHLYSQCKAKAAYISLGVPPLPQFYRLVATIPLRARNLCVQIVQFRNLIDAFWSLYCTAVLFDFCSGACTCMSFDPITRHCLSSFRPGRGTPYTRHIVS